MTINIAISGKLQPPTSLMVTLSNHPEKLASGIQHRMDRQWMQAYLPLPFIRARRDFVMTLAGFVAYSGALAIAAAIPGPGVTALVARALGSGFRSSLFMSLGLILGDLTYLTAVILGLAMVAQTFGTVFLIIKWAGVAYLAYLAWGLWTTGISAKNIKAKKSSGGAVSAVLAGLAITLGNPKTMLFYIALAPTLIDLRTITLADYSILAGLTVLVLLVVLVPYLALAAKARGLLASPRTLRRLNRTAAAFMAGAALAIAGRAS